MYNLSNIQLDQIMEQLIRKVIPTDDSQITIHTSSFLTIKEKKIIRTKPKWLGSNNGANQIYITK